MSISGPPPSNGLLIRSLFNRLRMPKSENKTFGSPNLLDLISSNKFLHKGKHLVHNAYIKWFTKLLPLIITNYQEKTRKNSKKKRYVGGTRKTKIIPEQTKTTRLSTSLSLLVLIASICLPVSLCLSGHLPVCLPMFSESANFSELCHFILQEGRA